MKWLGYKRVRLTSIHCDVPDIRKREKLEHVAELAADVAAHGADFIHAPTIRSDASLLCGRDRLAAARVNKAKTIWVHVAECTDVEAKELELAENIRRRADNKADLLTQYVALKKQQIRAAEEAQGGDTVTPARRVKSDQTVTAEARKEVARAAGVTTGAVKQAEARAKKAADARNAAVEQQRKEDTPKSSLPDGFNDFDLGMDAFAADNITALHGQLHGWVLGLQKLLGELTGLEKAVALPGRNIDVIRERLQAAGHAVRDALPSSLCFYCKGQPTEDGCEPCDSHGWVGRHGGDNVPAELKARGAAARVAVDGKFVPFGGANNARQAAKTGKPAKSICVVMDGEEVPLPLDDEPPADDDQEAFA